MAIALFEEKQAIFISHHLWGHSGQIRTVRYGGTFEIYIFNALYFMFLVLIPIVYDP